MTMVDIDFDSIDPERETKHAYFVVFESGFDEVSCFVPKSQVKIDHKRKVVTMPEWMAKEKGFDVGYVDGPDEGDAYSIY